MPLRTIQQQHLPDISLPIIYKRLKSFGFVSEKPIEKPYLNARHRHLRLQFAKEFLDRPVSFWRSIYFADESPFKNKWFVDLSSPNRIRKATLNSSTHPSCSYGAVNTLKEVFHIDPDHRRRSDVTILQDNAQCHISRKVGFNFLKTSKYAFVSFFSQKHCSTVRACSSFRYRHAPPTWTQSKIFSVC